MLKVSEKEWYFLCDYFKIGQNFDIYLDMIASISVLGTCNCYVKNIMYMLRRVV